jgi:hypothetical protein
MTPSVLDFVVLSNKIIADDELGRIWEEAAVV